MKFPLLWNDDTSSPMGSVEISNETYLKILSTLQVEWNITPTYHKTRDGLEIVAFGAYVVPATPKDGV